jgi:hypothetical protein
MSRRQELIEKVNRCKKDFTSLGDGPFHHFYCPILLVDEEADLCLGHVVNEAIPNSSRKTVPQRVDVDNFYGTVCESGISTFLEAHNLGADAHAILSNPKLRRKLSWTPKLNGKSVKCYEVKDHKHPMHPTVEFRDANGTVFTLAVKTTSEALSDAGHFEIVIDRDYHPEVIATLLKAAHLSQFAVLGYQHVFSCGGLMLADILKKFYVANRNSPRSQAVTNMKTYFPHHAGMVMPLVGFNPGILRGTVEDRRFMACLGSSGKWYGLGTFVRTGDQMHVVLTPCDAAENVDTFFDLIRDWKRKRFVYQLIEFVPATASSPTHWLAGEKQYQFDSIAQIEAVSELVTPNDVVASASHPSQS